MVNLNNIDLNGYFERKEHNINMIYLKSRQIGKSYINSEHFFNSFKISLRVKSRKDSIRKLFNI